MSENSVTNLHKIHRLRVDMDLQSLTVHAFSWINCLLRPLKQVIHWKTQLYCLKTIFHRKPIWKMLNSHQQKFGRETFALTYNTSLFLWFKNCHATLDCLNLIIHRGVSREGSINRYWKSREQTMSWHWHRQLGTIIEG